MTASSQPVPSGSGISTRRRRRLAAVGAAALAAAILWLAAQILGIELRVAAGGTQPPPVVTLPITLFMAAGSAALGWGALALLERVTRRARTLWTWLAVLVAVLSLAMPLTDQIASTATKLILLLMHVAVAAVVIPVFRRG